MTTLKNGSNVSVAYFDALLAYLELENAVNRLVLTGHITEAQAQRRIESAKSVVMFLTDKWIEYLDAKKEKQ